jgi:L-fuculose-phosphate aldolase
MSQHTFIVPALVDVCHRLAARGLVTATDGNVSARLPGGNILATRSGINKGLVTRNDLVEMTMAGEQVGGSGKPSTEMEMHLYVFRERPDVHAVVHAHPTYATGFATARVPLDRCLFPEVVVGMGRIPLAEYATPSTKGVGESLAPYVHDFNAILLTNHGAVTYGSDLLQAYFRMEKLEHAAHITFVATMLGGAHPLSDKELEDLRSVSMQSYGTAVSPGPVCETSDDHLEVDDAHVRAYILKALRERGVT